MWVSPHYFIMELCLKNYIGFHIATTVLVFTFLKCNVCQNVSTEFPPSFNNQEGKDKLHEGRKSKQFLHPAVVWPYLMGFGLPSSDNSQLHLPLNYHHSTIFTLIPTTPVRNGKFSQENQEKSSTIIANDYDGPVAIPCNTRDNEVGICRPFTKCFPMMEVQYGSEDYIDYMDVPLAEQLILNTNTSVCAESENVEEHLKVCCPRSTFRHSNSLRDETREDDGSNIFLHDDIVRRPVITQRPPKRNVLSRQLIEEQKCGKSQLHGPILKKPQGKITGGQESKSPQEFPWMVALFAKNKKIFCGASLITNQFLISASHCFSTFKAEDIQHLYAHLGDFNIATTTDGPHEVRKIEKIILHKGFRIENYHNDIALVKLDKPVNFTNRISPICLPEATMDSLERREIIVTGWGRKYRYGSTSDVLRKVEMPVWNLQECKNIYSRFAPGRVLESNLCAGDGRRNKDACLGDSGGPAVLFDGEKFVLVGITSWGKGCGSYPGLQNITSLLFGDKTRALSVRNELLSTVHQFCTDTYNVSTLPVSHLLYPIWFISKREFTLAPASF